MKYILKITILLLTVGMLFTACDDRELVTLDDSAKTVLTVSQTSLILAQFNDGEDVLNTNWTEPSFGFDSAQDYKLLIDFAGGDFSNPKTFAVGDALEKVFTKEGLNSALLSLGAEANTAMDFDFKVLTSLSDQSTFLSDARTITITTFPSILDLSTTWGVVGSATPNSWDGPDLEFFQTGEANIYAAYVNLADGQIKFRENNDWALNYGDNGADNTLDQDGTNIDVTAGSYKIIINLNDFTYTIDSFSWGMVGDATPNGWGGPDTVLKYDEYSDTFKAVVVLGNGEMKFRQNNDWAVNYGDTGADGTLESGGDNIIVTAGSYLVTLNLTDLDAPFYSLEATDIWGIVGDATPGGWGGPDVKFTPDFAGNDGLYYLNDVTLTTGFFKFRTNDDWGNNYGDDGNDGTLEFDGENISATPGTYNITLDFSDSSNPTYTIN
ncbi:MAG: SusE domain-containing protein [Flavobacteriaceae bacterium]